MPKISKPQPLLVCDSDLENLTASGITPATIRANHLRTVQGNSDELARILKCDSTAHRCLGGLIIPYRNLQGEENCYARVRPHVPRKGKDGKLIKYEAPKGEPPRVYIPVESLEALRDKGKPILICEGEKKALAMVGAGIAAIGISGFYGWKKKDLEELIDDLAAIDWTARPAVIGFDYDKKQETRQQAADALRRLAALLRKAGAKKVYAVELPPGPDGEKQGLDDYLVAHGPEALAELIQAAEPVPATPKAGLNARPLSEVESKEVDWLWEGVLARGKLTLISGNPGAGKTTAFLDWAARLTTGRAFPGGYRSPTGKGSILFATTEDDEADTIKPRFEQLGGDPTKFFTFQFVYNPGTNQEETLALDENLAKVDEWLAEHPEVVALGLDPISAHMGATDCHRDSEVRRVLAPLTKMAERRQISIVGINHLTKAGEGKAMYRSMGSIAFVAASRIAWQFTEDRDEPERKLLLPVRTSNCKEPPGFAFRLWQGEQVLQWEKERIGISADEALNGPSPSKREDAKELLLELLKDGPVRATEIYSRGEAEGFSATTLKLAKRELKIRAEKVGGAGGQWRWSLPAKEADHEPA